MTCKKRRTTHLFPKLFQIPKYKARALGSRKNAQRGRPLPINDSCNFVKPIHAQRRRCRDDEQASSAHSGSWMARLKSYFSTPNRSLITSSCEVVLLAWAWLGVLVNRDSDQWSPHDEVGRQCSLNCFCELRYHWALQLRFPRRLGIGSIREASDQEQLNVYVKIKLCDWQINES